MASLNNIFIIFLFSNLFLFQLINCCLVKNEQGCDDTRENPKSCCSALNCKTTATGRSFCAPYNCVKNEGASWDIGNGNYCCVGLFCSRTSKTCEKCLKEGESCGSSNLIQNYQCCDGLTCDKLLNRCERDAGSCRFLGDPCDGTDFCCQGECSNGICT